MTRIKDVDFGLRDVAAVGLTYGPWIRARRWRFRR
jgi:hypothetical protein